MNIEQPLEKITGNVRVWNSGGRLNGALNSAGKLIAHYNVRARAANIEEFKMSVYEMPIYKEHYTTFLELIKELDDLKVQSTQHKTIIDNTYEHLIKVFPLLNAGYNFWSMKGKLEIYNKVRALLSQIQLELAIIRDLEIFTKDYTQSIDSSIKYMNGLIRKLEHPNNEREKK